MEEFQSLYNGVIILMATGFGWYIKSMSAQIQRANERTTLLEIKLAGEYINKEDFHRMQNMIMEKLDHIENKLDGKADK